MSFRGAGRLAGTFSFVLYRLRLPPRPDFPDGRPLLIAVNHRSLLDSVVGFHAFLRWDLQPHFLVHQRYFAVPVLRRLLRATGCVPAAGETSTLELLRTVRTLLDAGRPVLIMPEGGVIRPRDWIEGMGPARRGVAAIVKMSGPVVLAVGMVGTDEVWDPDRSLPRLRLGRRRPEVRVVAELIEPDPAAPADEVLATVERSIRRSIAAATASRGDRGDTTAR